MVAVMNMDTNDIPDNDGNADITGKGEIVARTLQLHCKQLQHLF